MKLITGVVTSAKMIKTVVVTVTRRKVHRVYGKGLTVTKSYKVHDEKGVKVGDTVKISESRPISKTKRWKIAEVIK